MSDATAPQTDATSDRRSADIAIVCSHIDEIRPFLKALDRVRKYADGNLTFRGGFIEEVLRIAIVEAGRQFPDHRRAAEILIDEHNPAWIITAGFSGGLEEKLNHGDICLADSLCDQHGNSLPVRNPIPESSRIFIRQHVVADEQPQTAADKRALFQSHTAQVCDTTSLAVMQVCQEKSTQENRIRTLVARVIADEATESLTPEGWEHLYRRPPGQALGAVSGWLGKIRRQPHDPWKERSELVAKNLSRFLFSVVKQMGEKLGKSVL